MTRGRWLLMTAVAAAVAAFGIAVLLLAPSGAGFGWTAYAPLSGIAYVPGSSSAWKAVAILVIAVAAFSAGVAFAGSRTARLSAALPARFWVASGTVLTLGVAWLLVWPVRIGPCGIGQDDAVSCSGQQISAVGVTLPNLPGGTELAIVILAVILVAGVVVFLRTGAAPRR